MKTAFQRINLVIITRKIEYREEDIWNKGAACSYFIVKEKGLGIFSNYCTVH